MIRLVKGVSRSAAIFIVVGIVFIAYAVFSQDLNDEPGLELSVYSSDFAMVKDTREVTLDRGVNEIDFYGVPSGIDPTSVSIRDMTRDDTELLEQSYAFDVVSKERMLDHYIGKEITAVAEDGDMTRITGILLGYSGNEAILQAADGKIYVIQASGLELPALPSGLVTRPTVSYVVDSKNVGNHTFEVSYLTSGMGWSADYTAIMDEDETYMDMMGRVILTNNAGGDFTDARLSLVAGDVQRLEGGIAVPRYPAESVVKSTDTSGFSEEGVFEYHMYTLDRLISIADKEEKMLTLLEAPEVGLSREYVFDPVQRFYYETADETGVKVMAGFSNTEDNGLGMPLPAGRVRVYKEDSTGALRFIGEDSIDHTPENEDVRLFLGYAFDVSSDRKKTKINRISEDVYEESYMANVSNQKDVAITVTVVERPYGDWDVTESSGEYTAVSASRVEWRVLVPARESRTVSYTIRYTQ